MSEIGGFYENKTLLVTGATGFLGKTLLERILWQLPQVRRIVLMIRPRCDKDPVSSVHLRAQREIFSSPIFDRLRAHHGQNFEAFIREKVQVVSGDLTCPDLALANDFLRRFGDVDLIINVAALVRFDERLDQAISSNTLGPFHLLNFAKRLRNPTMLHVSTAFVHGERTGCLPEQLLEPGTSPHEQVETRPQQPFQVEREIEWALRLARFVESESRTPSARSDFRHAVQIQAGSNRIRNEHEFGIAAEKKRELWVGETLSDEGMKRSRHYGWFDTYTFTKAMGEQLLAKSADGVNLIILRPSIIESSFRQPEPGWIEGFQTSTPILFGYGKGEIPDFPGRRDCFIDFIPVDFVVSAAIAALTVGTESRGCKVFHIASSSENPLQLEDLMEYSREYFVRLPLRRGGHDPQPWRYPSPPRFKRWLDCRRQLLRMARALNDRFNLCPGAPRLNQKLSIRETRLERLEYLVRLYKDYMRLRCQFATDSTRSLFRSLNVRDQQAFFFDPSVINWREYIQEIHLPGVRRHVMRRSGPLVSKSQAAQADA